MPNLPLCNDTKDVECAEVVASKYFDNFLLDTNATHCNRQRPCSITEYSSETLLYGYTNDFDEDMGNVHHSCHNGSDAKAFILTYTFALPEQVSVFKEQRIFGFMQLVGNLGGAFSLFTGFSFFAGVVWIIRMILRSYNLIEKFYRNCKHEQLPPVTAHQVRK